jgi:polysaccharide biosynthesis/export protein
MSMTTLQKLGMRPLVLVAWLALASLPLWIVSVPAWAQTMREVIGPGDTIRITAYRNPDLTTEARLTDEGKLNVPLVGEMSLRGLTPDQAAKRIADRLKSGKYLHDPQITVTVVQARSRLVSILGFVNSPGRYELDGISAKISDVIAMAGGLDPNASDKIVLQPSGAGKSEPVIVDLSSIIQGDSSRNIEVRGGDSIFVPRASVVYVYGEVQKGGAYRIEPDMTVMQAISLAGGITPRGSESRVQIRRKGSDGKWKQFSVKLTDVVSPDDVIYVREGLF